MILFFFFFLFFIENKSWHFICIILTRVMQPEPKLACTSKQTDQASIGLVCTDKEQTPQSAGICRLIWALCCLSVGNKKVCYNTMLCGKLLAWFLTLLLLPSLTHCSHETRKRVIGKQCRPRSDATECSVWSGSPLFANSLAIFL